VERRGAPIQAFTRISDTPIRRRSQIYKPDYVIVQDPTLLESVDVASGLNDGGILIINSDFDPEAFKLDTQAKIMTVNATKIALDIIGMPIVNTVLLGAFAGAAGEIRLESITGAVREGLSICAAETHGMAQRGGSFVNHIRIGCELGSMIPLRVRMYCSHWSLVKPSGIWTTWLRMGWSL
jgi:2-oxoacid:acceptor oxidoreductase gamma subunit (pyruvate/2-ketoisovalerate family)